jgi:hypothetical protein
LEEPEDPLDDLFEGSFNGPLEDPREDSFEDLPADALAGSVKGAFEYPPEDPLADPAEEPWRGCEFSAKFAPRRCLDDGLFSEEGFGSAGCALLSAEDASLSDLFEKVASKGGTGATSFAFRTDPLSSRTVSGPTVD